MVKTLENSWCLHVYHIYIYIYIYYIQYTYYSNLPALCARISHPWSLIAIFDALKLFDYVSNFTIVGIYIELPHPISTSHHSSHIIQVKMPLAVREYMAKEPALVATYLNKTAGVLTDTSLGSLWERNHILPLWCGKDDRSLEGI